MANHSISIALCTYNGAAYIAEQLDSILGQTLPPDEIVIVDDGSTDDTPGIVRGYAEKYGNIHFFENEERLGFVRNFSRAISLTKGDYVALSDQDDIWTENHLEVLLSHIGDKAVCVGDAVMIGPDGRETGRKFSEIKENYFIPDRDVSKAYRIIYNYNPYQGASMLIDRKWVESLLPIPTEAGYHDTFLAGCASLSQGLTVIPDIITRYRMHEGQVTHLWKADVLKEIIHKRHFICYSSKEVLIDCLVAAGYDLSQEALAFIREFKQILELGRQKKWGGVLRIKNRHYRNIYSCKFPRHLLLRSLFTLLPF